MPHSPLYFRCVAQSRLSLLTFVEFGKQDLPGQMGRSVVRGQTALPGDVEAQFTQTSCVVQLTLPARLGKFVLQSLFLRLGPCPFASSFSPA